MGNTVYLPLFSVIRSFIAVRSVACFFLSFSLPGWVPCETFVVRLVSYCRRVSLTKMWSRFIYHWTFGHNARSHIGSHVDFFKRVIYFLFHCCFQPNGKKITGYFCARRTFIGSQRANKQLKHNDKRSDTNKKKLQMSCYWSQSSSFILQLVSTILQFTLHICWCLHTDRHTCTQTNKKSCFLLDWSTNVIKSAAKPSDQCKQTIK